MQGSASHTPAPHLYQADIITRTDMEVDPTPELDPITLRTPWGGRPNHLNPYAWRAAAAAAAATATVAEAAANRKRKRQVAPSSHPGQSSGAWRPGAGQVLGPTFRPLPHFHADSEEHTSDTSTSPWKRPTTAAQLKRRRRHWQPHAAGQSPTAVEMATDPDQSRVPPAVLAACHHEQVRQKFKPKQRIPCPAAPPRSPFTVSLLTPAHTPLPYIHRSLPSLPARRPSHLHRGRP